MLLAMSGGDPRKALLFYDAMNESIRNTLEAQYLRYKAGLQVGDASIGKVEIR